MEGAAEFEALLVARDLLQSWTVLPCSFRGHCHQSELRRGGSLSYKRSLLEHPELTPVPWVPWEGPLERPGFRTPENRQRLYHRLHSGEMSLSSTSLPSS